MAGVASIGCVEAYELITTTVASPVFRTVFFFLSLYIFLASDLLMQSSPRSPPSHLLWDHACTLAPASV